MDKVTTITARQSTILVVDDQPFNLMVLSELLSGDYNVLVAKNGAQALEIVAKNPSVDLILLDIMMPEMDGLEVCRRLKNNPAHANIPIIFVTAISEENNEKKGLELGAVDYIIKPISPPIVRARVKTHLKLHNTQLELERSNFKLEELVEERTEELRKTQDLTIFALAYLAEFRDKDTGLHIKRTKEYVVALSNALKARGIYENHLTDPFISRLATSAPLHDIGKIGIPDSILLKPRKLTKEEFEVMKTHTTLGHKAITEAASILNQSSTFLSTAAEIALSHHEKWNGEGYPDGLSAEHIPLSARIMSIADVYDALISKRVYKKAFPHDAAVEIIRNEAGTHFDPLIVKVFTEIHENFQKIALEGMPSPEKNNKAQA